MAELKDILVPDVGGDEVEVIEVCVAVGDTISEEDSIVTVESDKASMDIPAPFSGTVKEIKVALGDKISEGSLLIVIEAAGLATEAAPVVESAPVAAPAPVAEAKVEAAPAAATTGAVSTIEVTVPDIGTDDEVDIIDILVAVGDSVSKEDGLITLETDKATMDVPCPEDGVVKEIKVAVGGKVGQGSLVLLLETGAAQADAPVASAAPAPAVEAAPAAAPAPVAAAATSEVKDVEVPDIGTDDEVDVIDILVAVGDTVEAEQGLITLETDKATMDVPAPFAGVIKSLKIENGGKVSTGSIIATIETVSSAPVAAATAPEPVAAPVVSAPAKKAPPVVQAHPSQAGGSASGKNIHATPSVRRLASEFGVDLNKVTGSGRKGRILAEDVKSFVKYELSRPKATANSSVAAGEGGLQVLAQPKVDFSKFGEVEEVPLTRIQKISGPNLHRNWVTIPHVTQFDEADITSLEVFRKEQNATLAKQKSDLKITPLVFIMKAAASALAAYPQFSSSLSLDGESLIMKKYIHIGIAVDTPNGLVVPVVRDVDKKGVNEISRELMEISKKARDGKLTARDMQGGCFTISSLGGIGGTAFTPIVNSPEVGILGVSKSEMKPKWNGSDFEPKLMLPLSLSYDHRVIDGALAARFTVHLASVLSDIRKLVL
ncbi:acetyltransferase component of pyruvate dehydrogenase complex [Psychrosphaera saromensis]|uniref:Acetyltransferase component of pyruvate dehydrogenase complex n=1 Tax=Psychrosphaera saromensis TaxID=716813 RepID=A0A2S7UTG4_9GAMM|nr:pyruvate dehydrogenase complex dihydrolipoyllysine-residue acetyltransferase [Psychrosphaera saromensis]PQJ53264.1 pyruvate dehydrogenase complex dihydrolipoyllysine-residue acetyltransferase [Psychrosphaera saromensis]GHB66798.1 acetyltransferase component of pyruvate dehydrogenase complex [Psychrosphaera saromensis]GLQ14970.1 acetyltransferase component of pyruvate dehydrogenase complex [Psychrosphaera saromensis]